MATTIVTSKETSTARKKKYITYRTAAIIIRLRRRLGSVQSRKLKKPDFGLQRGKFFEIMKPIV